jgi:hypothetical protein
MPQKKYTLTESWKRLLLERYDGRPETIDALMEFFPGIPRWRVKRWAGELGLSRQKEPPWTPEKVSYLQAHQHRVAMRSIAKHLGRTLVAVRLKAKRLELRKSDEGYTLSALCLGLGTNHHKVERWLTRGWIKGSRRHTDRTRDMWFFTDQAIRQLVRKHPNEIDPRRVDWIWLVDVLLDGLGDLASP